MRTLSVKLIKKIPQEKITTGAPVTAAPRKIGHKLKGPFKPLKAETSSQVSRILSKRPIIPVLPPRKGCQTSQLTSSCFIKLMYSSSLDKHGEAISASHQVEENERVPRANNHGTKGTRAIFRLKLLSKPSLKYEISLSGKQKAEASLSALSSIELIPTSTQAKYKHFKTAS